MASGWNLWVWLECIGVLMGGVVRRYIDFLIILLIPTPLVLALFLQHHPYFFVHLKKNCSLYNKLYWPKQVELIL